MKQKQLRPVFVVAALIFQLGLLLFGVLFLSGRIAVVAFAAQFISVIALLAILNQDGSASLKLPWLLLLLSAPYLGGILYFLAGHDLAFRDEEAACQKAESVLDELFPQDDTHPVLEELQQRDPLRAGQFAFLERKGFPLCTHTETKFYPLADDLFPDLLAALEQAERYIFLEYFIITPGTMWSQILAILERKAAQGVTVKVLYDDVATMTNLPKDYPRQLRVKGIECIAVNPFIPVCTAMLNNRDHRKIASIDGRIAFTGGFNLADEYINQTHPYGHWKDNGIRVSGDAAWQLTRFFLTTWVSNGGSFVDADHLKPAEMPLSDRQNYIQPYAHTPLQGRRILGEVYCNILNQASHYVYLYTPYLIPDAEVMTALCLAADRGVTVKLIVPGIPDKKIIYQLTKAHYDRLLEHGVEIYEYTPGFVHAKSMVCDDQIVSIGTGNLDCRSLYHSFEDGCLCYDAALAAALRTDFEQTLTQCQQAQKQSRSKNIFVSVYYAVLRVLSPLL